MSGELGLADRGCLLQLALGVAIECYKGATLGLQYDPRTIGIACHEIMCARYNKQVSMLLARWRLPRCPQVLCRNAILPGLAGFIGSSSAPASPRTLSMED